jgi:hypothetical protein
VVGVIEIKPGDAEPGDAEPGDPVIAPEEDLYCVSKYKPGELFTLAVPSAAQFASPLLNIWLYRMLLFGAISKKYNQVHHVNSIPVLRLLDRKMVTPFLSFGS